MKIRNILFLTLLLAIATIFMPNFVNAGVGDKFIENELEYKIITENTVEVSGYVGAPTIVTIPKTIIYDGKTYTVISIGDKAFWECTSITNVTIQDTVITIGERAFYKCSALESVIIPNSVETIKDGAFQMCKSLTTIDIPFGVTEIGSFMFDVCESLTSVTIPDSVTIIETYAFYGCKALVNINIPDSVKIIEDRAFLYCDSLTIKIYDVINNLTNISNNGYNYALPEIKDYETVLSANKGYKLPKNISVKVGGYDLSLNDYEYDLNIGKLKINADRIIGNIEIEAIGEKIYKISFDANGGEFSNGDDILIFDDVEEFDYANLEEPTRKGYEFIGYYNQEESLEDIMNGESGIDDDMIFYAKWEQKELKQIKVFEHSENQEFFIGKDKKLIFELDNDRGEGKVFVDGEELNEKDGDYTWNFVEGTYPSITLCEEYIKTLKVGKHTIKFIIDEEFYAKTTFEIVENKDVEDDDKEDDVENDIKDNNSDKDKKEENNLNNPKTGDNILIFVGILIISIIGILVTTKLRKNIKNK